MKGMKAALGHPRMMLVLAGVVAAGAVLRVGDAAAAPPSPSITVTCEANQSYYGAARAVFSWLGNGIGSITIMSGGTNYVQLMAPGKSGTFTVDAAAVGPAVEATAQLYSAPDKSGSVALLGEASTPAGGCPYI